MYPLPAPWKINIALLWTAVFLWVFATEAPAQSRGGGYRPPPPVFRPAPNVQPRPMIQPRIPQPRPPTQIKNPNAPRYPTKAGAPGSAVSRPALQPAIKPSAPVASMPSYKGQVTPAGKPVIEYKGKNWQIPHRGVSTKSNLLASTSSAAVSSRWSASRKVEINKSLVALAKGTGAASNAKSALQSERLKADLAKQERDAALQQQKAEAGRPIAGSGTKKPLDQRNRLSTMYGGGPGDWIKKTSKAYIGRDGKRYATHWYENKNTGQRVEEKVVVDEPGTGRVSE